MARLPARGMTLKDGAYRPGRRARGMKLIRIWVPDPDAPGFRAEAQRQAALLRGAPEEEEALAFIEAAADMTDWE